MMKQEFFQCGDPRGWTIDELSPVNLPNCRCTMTAASEDSIDAEFIVIDENKMIEEKQ